MVSDPHAVAPFYETDQGRMVAGLLRERLALIAPPAGAMVAGIGYTLPYLSAWADGRRCVSVLSGRPERGQMELGQTELGAAGPACVAVENALPFADLSCDAVLLVHGLEAAESARRLLRECWRVLRDDGRLIVVAPNRRGLWALSDATPFGQGQPYSAPQLARLLQAALFCIERQEGALYVPPSRLRLVLRGAEEWERLGRRFLSHLAGVTITEASKDLYGALPLAGAEATRRVLALEGG